MKFRNDLKNNLPILIGFYPILNAITLSGFLSYFAQKMQFSPIFESHSPERASAFRIG
jgi:hypothetical protein